MSDNIAFLANPAPPPPAAPAPRGGLWDGEGFGFSDFLDLINPLQHIPVVSTLYRALTGDTIGAAPRIAGGALFGGPVGMISALGGAAMEQRTGKDVGDTLLALATGETLTPVAFDAAEPVEAPDSAPDAQPSMAEILRAPYAAPDFGVRLAAAEPVEAPDSAPDVQPSMAEILRAPYAAPDFGVRLAAAEPVEAPDSAPDAIASPAVGTPAPTVAAIAAQAAPAAATGSILPAAPAARGAGAGEPWAWLPRTAPIPVPVRTAPAAESPAAGAAPAGAADGGEPATDGSHWFVQAMHGALDRYEASAGLAARPTPGRTMDLRR